MTSMDIQNPAGSGIIDLRSDTVTLPTPEMRMAMANAVLGDDVFREDPTVHALEKLAATKLGKESALFVASGTMGNLVALLTHCARSEGVVVGDRSHVLLNEVGGTAGLGGICLVSIPNQADGTLDFSDLENAIPFEDIHHPRVKVVCLENTHNFCGGAVLDAEYTKAVADIAHNHGAKLHIDGARIFNAAIALGVKASELAAEADSITFCLSKGLSAPVGSVLCGDAEFIERARRVRKMVGGGMRQVGVLAAAGIVALETMVNRLQEDHANAQILAKGIAKIPGLRIDPATVRTDIVFFDLVDAAMTAEQFVEALGARGVRILALGRGRLRAVTHYGIVRSDVDRAIEVMAEVMSAKPN